MKIGFIGLGRMGSNMVMNLAEHNHKVIINNRSEKPIKKLSKRKNVFAAYTVPEIIKQLPKQKIIWIMVKSGSPVDSIIENLLPHLKKDDIIIDGGNSYFKDSQRRYKYLKKKGINFLDCGVSGGMEGARHGACMMIGGEREIFDKTKTLFRDMCVKEGYGYMGKSGAGHFVKGIHNGIEYGMMGAINEGLKAVSKYKNNFNTDLKEVAKVYSHGSIIESRLMSWLYDSFKIEGYLDEISCSVPRGETEEEMRKLEKMAPMPVLKAARNMRVHSRTGKFCGDYISAMRNQFGGHKTNKKK